MSILPEVNIAAVVSAAAKPFIMMSAEDSAYGEPLTSDFVRQKSAWIPTVSTAWNTVLLLSPSHGHGIIPGILLILNRQSHGCHELLQSGSFSVHAYVMDHPLPSLDTF